jgi:tetratricopeptide (TPR) repeat protein
MAILPKIFEGGWSFKVAVRPDREGQMLLAKLRLCAAFATLACGAAAHAQMGMDMAPTPMNQEADPTIPFHNGIVAFDAGDYPKAIKELLKARAARPEDGTINYALGMAYNAATKKKEAKQAFQRAVRAHDAPIGAYLQLGLVSLDLGDRTTAAAQLALLDKKLAACGAGCAESDQTQIKAAKDKLAAALSAP